MVTKDIPPYAIVGGNPAQIIKFRYDEAIIDQLLNLQWWKYGPEILNDVNLLDINECIEVIKTRKERGLFYV